MIEKYQKKKISQWSPEERPREKAQIAGVSSLSNSELIAILLRNGTREDSAVDLARELLGKAENSLTNLCRMEIGDIMTIKGIGPAKAITLSAALELGRRRKADDEPLPDSITSSNSVYEIFGNQLSDLKHEEFWVLHLSRANKIISKQKVSQGGVSGTVADIRIILKDAIMNLASSIVICHNHPSGNCKPSKSDLNLTKKICEAASIFDIRTLDHVIVGRGQYFSFADEDLI